VTAEQVRKTAGGQPPRGPALSLRDTHLGLSLTFHAPAHLDTERVTLLLRDEVPVIRRFLEDPVNWPVVGRRPDARRNAFLALLLSVDRVGGEDFSVLPLDRVCDVARHRKNYSGPPCPLCHVVRLVGRVHGEGLVRITGVVGEADDKGHYLIAERITLQATPKLEVYREKVRRLPLPPVLKATRRSQKKMSSDPAATWVRLCNIPVQSWEKLTLELTQDYFKANGIIGYPRDLELAHHEWDILLDLARAGGSYKPKLLGPVEAQFRESFARLAAVLKKAFPQIPGEPLRRTGIGSYEANVRLRIARQPLDLSG
jgi:hypothetical protein